MAGLLLGKEGCSLTYRCDCDRVYFWQRIYQKDPPATQRNSSWGCSPEPTPYNAPQVSALRRPINHLLPELAG